MTSTSSDPRPSGTPTDTTDAAGATAPPTAPPRRKPGRRVAEVGVVVLALVAVALVGISRFGPDHDGFCDQVAALPSLRTEAATPAATLVAYAEGMERVADTAGAADVAAAATTIGTYHQRLATAIGAGPTSTDLLDDVDSIDTSDLAAAHATLDRAITQRCS